MSTTVDWYDRVGIPEHQKEIAVAREIEDELSSGGKVISFSVYKHTGMTAAQWKASRQGDCSTGKEALA